MSQFFGPVFDRKDYAGFWRRSAALTVDCIILITVYVCISAYWYEVLPGSWVTETVAVNVEFGLFLFVLAYGFLFCLTDRGTIGYRIVGIRYAHMRSQDPDAIQILYRSAVTILMIRSMFLIDHLWVLFDPCKQTWHDKVSGFYVIRRKAQPIGTQQVAQSIVSCLALSFLVWEPLPAARPVQALTHDRLPG